MSSVILTLLSELSVSVSVLSPIYGGHGGWPVGVMITGSGCCPPSDQPVLRLILRLLVPELLRAQHHPRLGLLHCLLDQVVPVPQPLGLPYHQPGVAFDLQDDGQVSSSINQRHGFYVFHSKLKNNKFWVEIVYVTGSVLMTMLFIISPTHHYLPEIENLPFGSIVPNLSWNTEYILLLSLWTSPSTCSITFPSGPTLGFDEGGNCCWKRTEFFSWQANYNSPSAIVLDECS